MSKLIALRLPDDLAGRLEARCSIRGQSKTDALIEAIRRGWDEDAEGVEAVSARAIKPLSIPGVFMGSGLSLAGTAEPIEDFRRLCLECDKRMAPKMYKGIAVAWACNDPACPMYGLERKR